MVASGVLPQGLTLDSSTGLIAGLPAAAGTFSFTVTVTDVKFTSVPRVLSIQIAGPLPVGVVTESLPDGSVSVSYQATLEAANGFPPYTWRVVEGGLPPGLALNAGTGEISGTPTTQGEFAFAVEVEDTNQGTAARALSIEIGPAPLAINREPG
jgi:hypothetical protein